MTAISAIAAPRQAGMGGGSYRLFLVAAVCDAQVVLARPFWHS
jgi:hypothetical protein